MTKRSWTREQLDFLSDRYGQPGWTSMRIAKAMPGKERTAKAVRRKAEFLGITTADGLAWRRPEKCAYALQPTLIESGQRPLSDYIDPQNDTRHLKKLAGRKAAAKRARERQHMEDDRPRRQAIVERCVERAGNISALSRTIGIPTGTLSAWSKGKYIVPDERLEVLESYLEGKSCD